MIKPKLALIPAAQGSKLYSVLPSSGVGDFNFTRGSAATRVNKDGLIETVGSGVSRLNYPLIDGVVNGCPSHLLEPQRLQFIQYSEDFSQGYWTKLNTSISSGFISPNGGVNSFKLIENTSFGDHRIDAQGITTSSGLKYTLSMFLKKDGDREWFKLRDFTTNAYINVNLSNGTIGATNLANSTQNSEYYGNGWYRVSFTFTASSSVNLRLYIGVGDNNTSYLGNGSNGVLMYGVQLEQGSYPTSYIPTNGSASTRSSETANGSGDASTFNDSEGVLMAEINLGSRPTTLKTITLSDGTASNQIDIRFYPVDWNIFIKDAFYLVSYDLLDITASNKLALYYNNGNTKVYINGILLDSKTYNGSFVGLNKLNLSWSDAGSPFYGSTKQIQYFDSALNDSDLETLTSWQSFTDMANGQLYIIE